MRNASIAFLCAVLPWFTSGQEKAELPRALDQHLRVHPGMVKHILLDGLDGKGARISARLEMGSAFAVITQPEHGKLYGEPPTLRYVPDTGFKGTDRFTFRVTEGGESKPGTVDLNVVDWKPPIGIPAPTFGITQTHRMYKTKEFDFGEGPKPYPSAEHGPYTHYVDNSHKSATDKENPFGSAEKPRKTIPLVLTAGSVVEVHGGPYKFPRDRVLFTANGTAKAPVFLRSPDGAERVRFEVKSMGITGSWFVIENFEMLGTSGGTGRKAKAEHVVIRNCEFHHHTRSNCINVGGKQNVVFNNYIHHIGNHDNPNDRHGFHARANAEKIWFVDNHVHHCTGDGTQFAHGARNNNEPRFVYVGRNIFHDDLENAVDIKFATDVIISQNTCYGYRPISRGKSGSDGTAMVLGSDGGPNRVWVLFNTIYDSKNAIRNEETVDAWIIGNVMYDLLRGGIVLEKKGTNLRIVNNTIVNAAISVDQMWKPHFGLNMANNIIVGIGKNKYNNHFNIERKEVSNRSTLNNTLFWQHGKPLVMLWGGTKTMKFTSDDDFKKFPKGKGNLLADPRFKAAGKHDFRLSEGSPAIDGGVPHPAYEEFKKRYGIDIQVDHDGVRRPQGKGWDMGAFEVK